MGYDVHITRRKCWSDKGADITAEEWLSYVAGDPELRLRPESGRCFAEWTGGAKASWFDWSDGVIFTKNPDDAVIAKIITIAQKLGATVQGDDGEIYDGSGPPRQQKVSFGTRLASLFSRERPKPQQSVVAQNDLPFNVGDKVVDAWGFEHTILSIDPAAEHGMGKIQSRRSNDGTLHSYALIAHGFKPVPKK